MIQASLWRHRFSCFFFLLYLFFGCAERPQDINRVQPNLIAKSDLEGEWYMMQTVVDLPPTTYFTFIGETSVLERVRWEIQEDMLIAYRSYERLRGAESTSVQVPFDGKEAPVAAYSIISHVDVQREYNSSTGEQSNVISENTTDRPWFERKYVRVDWSASLVPNFELIAPTKGITPAYFEPAESGRENALYSETDRQGVMNYFDVTSRYFVEPDEYGCIYALYYLGVGDCASAELGVRASFSRVPDSKTYEPFQYDDPLMSRFGYFRTEYYEYDEQRGTVDGGRRNFINRHNIWERAYDEDGVLIPLSERKAKTVTYYLNSVFPQDLIEAAQVSVAQWNRAMVKGLQKLAPNSLEQLEVIDSQAQVFTLCHNPVQEGDAKACGELGFTVREGDLRYSTLHWVDSETMAGLLGYGPAATDPISGEIISGRAYIYGAAVNTYASYALDVIRYFSEQVSIADLANGDNFTQALMERLAARPLDAGRIEHPSSSTQTVSLNQARAQARPRMEARKSRQDLKPHDALAIQDRLRTAPARPSALGNEMKKALEAHTGKSFEDLPVSARAFAEELSPELLKNLQAKRKKAIARSADLMDMIAPDVEGIVKRYALQYEAGQDDALWYQLREEIFAAVAEHELGHTLGLRHNFQGSYDSINYPDNYWSLRQENLEPVETIQDFFNLNRLTETQSNEGMRQLQYSSIMDYGFSWQSDLNGLGRYDEAALIFGYTSHLVSKEDCEAPTTEGDRVLPNACVKPIRGLVEVFKKNRAQLGCAGHLLDPPTPQEKADGAPAFNCDLPGLSEPKREYVKNQLDANGPSVAFEGFSYDDPGLPSVTLLERYHYTSFAQALPSLDDLSAQGRELMLYEDYLKQRENPNFDERRLRVPYLFCSDEWESALLSCHAFDHGADPYELMQNKQYSYQAYYPFVNFRRDRPEFEIWHPLFTYFFRDFLPLSDLFQSWYVAPYGYDNLFDTSYEAAIAGSINLLMNVLSTPSHGTYCENNKGELVYLGDSPNLQSEDRADPDCKPDASYIYLPPGQGRRHFSTYDPEAGYQFELKPEEAGHYWATLAAAWALFDTEAYLIGLDGDAGVYAISFFDWFEEEFYEVFASLLTDDYQSFAPRALPEKASPNQGETPRLAKAHYLNSSSFYGYDPLTGNFAEDPIQGLVAGSTGLCESCESNNECAGFTGYIGGTFCGSLDDGSYACLQDCTQDASVCAEGFVCDANKNCVPGRNIDACAPYVAECSSDALLGSCPDGSSCREGECYEAPESYVIQSDPTFMLKTDIFWYGFLYTTASYSTRFNDQFNVFRPGTPGQVIVGDEEQVEMLSFTDPESGITYAASQPKCSDLISGGTVGLCGTCEVSTDCAGYSEGYYGEVFCVDDGNGGGICAQDCTNDASLCGFDYTCEADTGNCLPTNGICVEETCDAEHPTGACDEGFTCDAGTCIETNPYNPQCDISGGEDRVSVKLIKHGQSLAERYLNASDALVNFSGTDAEYDLAITEYYRSRFYLRSHVELLETLRATYDIFGQVY